MNEEKERVDWETVLERVRVRQLHCISIKNRKTREQMMIEQQLSLSLSLSAFVFLRRVLCKDDDDDDEEEVFSMATDFPLNQSPFFPLRVIMKR